MNSGLIGRTRGKWVTLCLAIVLSGCGQSHDASIESVLNRCARLAEQVNRSGAGPGEAADFFASSMQEIDTRACPADFRIAFQHHINAWREAAPQFANATGRNAFIEAFAAGLLQDPSLYGASQQGAERATQRINETYYELANIAVAHGARVPNSVVGK